MTRKHQRPMVTASPWCEKHWIAFREGVQAETHSGIAATQVILQMLVRHPDFERRVKSYAIPGRLPGNIELQWAIQKTAPHCCFLGDKAMKDLLAVVAFSDMRPEVAADWRKVEAEVRAASFAAKNVSIGTEKVE